MSLVNRRIPLSTRVERGAAVMLSIALALIATPIGALLGLIIWVELFGFTGLGRDLMPILVGFCTFMFVMWRAPVRVRRVLERRLHQSEFYGSYLALVFGISGALLTGSLVATVILILGHMRPVGLEFAGIPFAMGIAFVACFFTSLICYKQTDH